MLIVYLNRFQLLFVAIVISTSIGRADEISIVSWGGAHTHSLQAAYYVPFTREKNIAVRSQHYIGGLIQLRQQVVADAVLWDVIDLSTADASRACQEGLLETLPLEQLPGAADVPARDDFLPQSLIPCAVGYSVWSLAMVYSQNIFKGDSAPRQLVDLFDLERFPGKRGLPKSPRGLLEWALLIQGVAPEKIYADLSSPTGVERALQVLQPLREYIIWWQSPDEMETLLATGEVVMGAMYSSSLFEAVIKRQRDIDVIWQGQQLMQNWWGIPKGSHQFSNAWQFIQFATAYDQLPMLSNWVAYGPTRQSSLLRIDSTYLPWLPTATNNLQQGMWQDSQWWELQGAAVEQRFIEWLHEEG